MTRTLFTILISAVATIAQASELIEVTRMNDVAQVRTLLEGGADTESRDAHGNTALHFAAGYGYAEIAQVLVDFGADVNAVGRIGNTPLQFAAEEGITDVARILIENGANTQVANDYNSTPMKSAKGWGHRDIVELLASAEATRDDVAGNSLAVIASILTAVVVPVLGARLVGIA